MQKFIIRYITLTSILAISVGITFWIQYSHPIEKRIVDISKIPLKIESWTGKDFSVDRETKDILETDAVLMRKYTNQQGEEVFLAIVYYKDSRVALHLPESCLMGHGSELTYRGVEEISIPNEKKFYANKLLININRINSIVIYYFETGDIRTSSYEAMRWQMILNKLKSKGNSGALVRFSAFIKENQEKTLAELKQFIKEAAPIISKSLF